MDPDPAARPAADLPVPAVAVVGAGRVGTALAAALRRAGVPVTGPARRGEAAAAAAGAGLVLLCVPDDAVAGLAAALAARAGQVLAHTSGRHGLAVLGDRPRRAAVHPAMTFTGDPADADRVAGATFGLTADPDARPAVAALVAALGGRPAWVAEADRPLYHAALANASNHLVTLVAQSADWLRRAGVPDPGAALAPIARAALANALDAGDAALTGPVVRGDAAAVAGHLAALPAGADVGGPDAAAASAYRALALLTAARAHAAGRLGDDALAALRAVLAPVR